VDQARPALILLLCACAEPTENADAGKSPADAPFATAVVQFSPGEGAGFGADKMPGVVLGAPKGHGERRGSMDVVSLGKGGQITLGFEPRRIIDGQGDDLVVFENAFWSGGNPEAAFTELGRVELSQDGQTWHAFNCQQDELPPLGCAGFSPSLECSETSEPEDCGGDAFDLADLGLDFAHFIRITDLSFAGEEPSAGFDLDAVGLIHYD
jgi:hypothetical protein